MKEILGFIRHTLRGCWERLLGCEAIDSERAEIVNIK